MGNGADAAAGLANQLREAVHAFVSGSIPWIAAAAVFFLLFIIARLLIARRKRRSSGKASEPGIDLRALNAGAPPPGSPVLEFYNIPVRLAGVVLAPAGRVSLVPSEDELAGVFEAVTPGLSDVVGAHRPDILCWPPQMSSKGFANKVFGACSLPLGTDGRSSWCAAAGVVEMKGRPLLMAGLILHATRPVSNPCRVIENPEEWLGFLRVKMSQT